MTAPSGAAPGVAIFLLLGAAIGLVVGAATAQRTRGALGVATMLPLVLIGGVMGGIGLLLSWLWIGTPYSFAVRNANILFFSPLLILVPPLAILAQHGVRSASRWLVVVLQLSVLSALAGLSLRVLSGTQHSDRMAALACPLLVGALAGALRMRSATVVPARVPSIISHPSMLETSHQTEIMT
jgi:hypothetical protein